MLRRRGEPDINGTEALSGPSKSDLRGPFKTERQAEHLRLSIIERFCFLLLVLARAARAGPRQRSRAILPTDPAIEP